MSLWPLLLSLLAADGLVSPARLSAFHEQGVANCDSCHLSHPGDRQLLGASADGLLIAESPSDVCLLCHAEQAGAVLGADPLTPPRERGAGNFVFLLENDLNDAPEGTGGPILGHAAGHNVVAPGHGLDADPRHATAPGGSFPSSRLGCTSCHDPHGNASFRMLYGRGPVMAGEASFASPAPEAAGIGLGSGSESRSYHTAYLSGMSAWCGNCHGRYHTPGSGSGFVHEDDRALGASASQRYNEYEGDRNPDGGSPATAYLAEVPFEDTGSETSSSAGAAPTSRIMCLSCHRAHASSAPAAGRWDFAVALLRDDGRRSGSYPIPNPYGDPEQGSLCAKCHELAGGGNPLELLESWEPIGSPPGETRHR